MKGVFQQTCRAAFGSLPRRQATTKEGAFICGSSKNLALFAFPIDSSLMNTSRRQVRANAQRNDSASFVLFFRGRANQHGLGQLRSTSEGAKRSFIV